MILVTYMDNKDACLAIRRQDKTPMFARLVRPLSNKEREDALTVNTNPDKIVQCDWRFILQCDVNSPLEKHYVDQLRRLQFYSKDEFKKEARYKLGYYEILADDKTIPAINQEEVVENAVKTAANNVQQSSMLNGQAAAGSSVAGVEIVAKNLSTAKVQKGDISVPLNKASTIQK